MIVIVSCSLSTASKSRALARLIHDSFANESHPCTFIDLADYNLPLCDADKAYRHPDVKKLAKILEKASAIIMALPIYNYSISAATKNFIELVGASFENKIVGFVCAAGGQKSYMSILHLANSLLLDFRCLIVPKFVYVDSSSFSSEGKLENEEITSRLHELYATIVRLKKAWSQTGV